MSSVTHGHPQWFEGLYNLSVLNINIGIITYSNPDSRHTILVNQTQDNSIGRCILEKRMGLTRYSSNVASRNAIIGLIILGGVRWLLHDCWIEATMIPAYACWLKYKIISRYKFQINLFPINKSVIGKAFACSRPYIIKSSICRRFVYNCLYHWFTTTSIQKRMKQRMRSCITL